MAAAVAEMNASDSWMSTHRAMLTALFMGDKPVGKVLQKS